MTPKPPTLDSQIGTLTRATPQAADLLRELAECLNVEALLARHLSLTRQHLQTCLEQGAIALTVVPGLGLPPMEEPPTVAPHDGAPPPLGLRRLNIPGYEILKEVGRGGMGVVYKARHLGLNRVVALKMLLAGEYASEDVTARFRREAEAVAQLAHPNIVQIYEVGECEGQRFLALEFVEGGSLVAESGGEPWPAQEAAVLVEKMAGAMHFAHEKGIIHRDLKPENVLIGATGEPRITDFGLARRLSGEDGRTQTGAILGTPSYMAPEQAGGRKDVGTAADVYALGAILYRLLSGRPPFEGPTTDVLVQVLAEDPTPLRQLNPAVPRDLETIVLKCLRKEPARRYASARELERDLRRFLDGDPIHARRLSAARLALHYLKHHPGLGGSRALVLLLLFIVTAWGLVMTIAGSGAFSSGILIPAAWVSVLPAVLFAPTRAAWKGGLVGAIATALFAAASLSLDRLRPDAPWMASLSWVLACVSLLLGLVGAALGRRWVVLLGAALLVAVLYLTDLNGMINLFYASAAAGLFGLGCRLMRWWQGGNSIDIVCCATLGGVIGICLGWVLVVGIVLPLATFGIGDTFWVVAGVCVVVSGLLGCGSGAFLAALVTAQAARREARAPSHSD